MLFVVAVVREHLPGTPADGVSSHLISPPLLEGVWSGGGWVGGWVGGVVVEWLIILKE